MSTKPEDIKRYLLQILYYDFSKNRYISSTSLATALELEESDVENGLGALEDSGLVDIKESEFRLSEKGYTSIHQRFNSYCPHL